MQVSVETKEGLKRHLRIVVPAGRVDNAVEKRIREMAPKIKLPGFRAGKVPMAEVRRRYGASLRQEVIGQVIQETFYEAVKQENMRLSGAAPQINIEKSLAGQPLEYIAEFEVLPEFTAVELEGAHIKRPQVELVEEDINNAIENLRKQHTEWKEVDRASKEGDQLVVSYKGLMNGEVFEGGSANDVPLVLGSKTMIPGFEEGLIGLKAEENKTLELTFPDNYQAALAGKPVTFEVKVTRVLEPHLPPIDDDLAKKFGVKTGNLEGLRDEVRKNLQRTLEQIVNARVKRQVIEKLIELNDIDTPDLLVDNEIKRLQEEVAHRYAGGSKEAMQKILANLNRDKFAAQAAQNVKISLIFSELIKEKNLTPDADKVKKQIEMLSTAYQDPEKVVSWYYNNEQQLAQIKHLVLEEQLVEELLKAAKVEDETLSYTELLASQQQ